MFTLSQVRRKLRETLRSCCLLENKIVRLITDNTCCTRLSAREERVAGYGTKYLAVKCDTFQLLHHKTSECITQPEEKLNGHPLSSRYLNLTMAQRKEERKEKERKEKERRGLSENKLGEMKRKRRNRNRLLDSI